MKNRYLRLALSLLVAVALLALFLTLRQSGEHSTTGHAIGVPVQTPNVLLIIADDMGVDKMGAYADDVPGYRAEAAYLPDTPVLDDLASVGVRFTDAWANPSCSPTRGALFTGNHAFRTGVGKPIGKEGASNLQDSAFTIAETLGLEGYTSGMFGKWHLGENAIPEDWSEGDDWGDHLGERFSFQTPALVQGWDRFYGSVPGGLDADSEDGGYYSWVAVFNNRCEGCAVEDPVQIRTVSKYATIETIGAARDWIAQQDRPWMVSLTLNAPHTPFELPPSGCNYRAEDGLPPQALNQPAVYEEMVECMDRQLGVLLDSIDDLANTLVIFVGDNGTDYRVAEGDFDDDRGKGTLYESGVRVPLIIADGAAIVGLAPDEGNPDDCTVIPGVGLRCRQPHRLISDPGSTSDAPVHVVDLFATIAETVGAQSNTGLDSVSLVPLLSDVEGPVREVNYAEAYSSDGSGNFALRSGDWKLTGRTSIPDDSACLADSGLFNLSSDRFEAEDLTADAQLEGEAQQALSELLSELDALADSADTLPWFAADDCP